MKITLNTKYNIGDIIKIKENRGVSETCETCEGRKEITIKGKTFKCPNCCGEGHLLKYKTVETEVLIYKMEIEISKDHSNEDKLQGYCKYYYLGGKYGEDSITERIEL